MIGFSICFYNFYNSAQLDRSLLMLQKLSHTLWVTQRTKVTEVTWCNLSELINLLLTTSWAQTANQQSYRINMNLAEYLKTRHHHVSITHSKTPIHSVKINQIKCLYSKFIIAWNGILEALLVCFGDHISLMANLQYSVSSTEVVAFLLDISITGQHSLADPPLPSGLRSPLDPS